MKNKHKPFGFALKPMAVAIHMALTVAVLTTSTVVMADEIRVQHYNIQAGDLVTALNQFALQSKVALVGDNKKLTGLKSSGLIGSYGVEQGFAKLLEQSNLHAQKTQLGYMIVEKPKAQPSAEPQHQAMQYPANPITDDANALPVIELRASQSLADQSKNNYTVSRSSSATKLDLALKDTPQSISIITQKQIEEQNLQNVNDVLEATPGITVSNFGVPGAGRATFYSRGYEISNVMVDGNPTLISGSRGMELLAGYDTIIYDRVEVTRGSTGLSTGTGDPSGSINFVRKRPSKEAEGSAKLSYGRWDKKRVELDVSQPFNQDASIRGRFVAAYSQGDSYIDRLSEESKIFYGIIEADLGDQTTLALGGTFFDKDVDAASPHMTSGASSDPLSRGEFDGGRYWNAATDWSYAHIRNWNGFITLDHKFNDNWKLSTNYQYSKSTPDRKWGVIGSSWYNEEYNTASYSIGREKPNSDIHNLDMTLMGKFNLFGREAQIATGINGYQSKTFDPIYGTRIYIECHEGKKTKQGCVNLDDWNNGAMPYPENTSGVYKMFYGQFPIDDYRNTYYDRTERQYGYFFSTKFEPLERLKVILGTRYNHYNIYTDYYLKGNPSDDYAYNYKPKDKWIPYAGLIYDLTENTTAYASYTGIYKTQLEKDLYDEFLPFVEGNSYEMGVKSSLFNDTLNLHTAIFRMQEENTPHYYAMVPVNPETGQQYRCTNPLGGLECDPKFVDEGSTITGFEISAAGQLTPAWLINAGYTYLHVDRVSRKQDGFSYAMTSGIYSYERPKHAINFSTSYQLNDDLTIGGAARWKSKTTQGLSGCMIQSDGTESCSSNKDYLYNQVGNQGSFIIVDLMGRYKINEHLVAGLNISNLFDKSYKRNYMASLYGEPRNITISLSSKF
ncbi:TonB-dependent siderophore receptor [Acinetobacter larvae]|uniref:Secretin/TonB short N-terminal domain-containing protein n=1 Tax=Acinetobacter larvae TaxID=1789224 RepID=A0A1B2LXT3_9GAMM|nr:TonB-dependent receptor [Acinetobacter larvae]AOA57746.1 hypothetical protein BFG52_04830 [Acinetobacter larvae]